MFINLRMVTYIKEDGLHINDLPIPCSLSKEDRFLSSNAASGSISMEDD